MNPGAMVGKMLEGIENAILLEKPDFVLVYGDNDSSLAGALAASKLQIPVAHVEAGLRSFNMRMPEEVNRILTDRISTLLFCPSVNAVENLKKEGFDSFPCKIYNTGDVLQDAAMYYGSTAFIKSDIINQLNINQSFALATISRKENVESPSILKEIVTALNLINREQQIVVPLHPRVYRYLKEANIELNFKIIPPLRYFDMIELLKHCTIVLTDSSGVQREAFVFGKNCVALRRETEWTELVQNGFSMMGSTDSEFILIAYHEMMNRKSNFSMDLYGKGKASERIAEILKNWKV
jgi:UDP-GlcNAc3NAcA epimerase